MKENLSHSPSAIEILPAPSMEIPPPYSSSSRFCSFHFVTNDVPGAHKWWGKHQKLYLKDGNMILVAGSTLFKVYAGLLVKESNELRNLMEGPRPPNVALHEGIEVIRVLNSETDVAWFLQAALQSSMSSICDTPLPCLAEHFTKAASILGQSSTYGADKLFSHAIRAFEDNIPQSYDEITNKRELFEKWIFQGNSNPPVAIYLLDFFRQHKLQKFLPWVLYLLSTMPSHAQFRRQILLSQDDIQLTLKGKEEIQQWSHSSLSEIISASYEPCLSWSCTKDLRSRWISALLRCDVQLGVHARIEQFEALERGDTSIEFRFLGASTSVVGASSTSLPSPCHRCKEVWLQKEKECTMKFWDKLPTFYDLPTWFTLSREKYW